MSEQANMRATTQAPTIAYAPEKAADSQWLQTLLGYYKVSDCGNKVQTVNLPFCTKEIEFPTYIESKSN